MSDEEQTQQGEDGEEWEDMTTEDMVDQNGFMIDALVDLLIEKGVITKEEYEKKLEALDEALDAEEESDDESEESE